MNQLKKRHQKRVLIDRIYNGFTYLSSGISLFVLLAIFLFIFQKGSLTLSFDLLKSDYWSQNYLVAVQEDKNTPGEFARPQGLDESIAWSSKWGIGLVDSISREKQELILIETMAPGSPFESLIDTSVGENQGKPFKLETGLQIHKISFTNHQGISDFTGTIASQKAHEVVEVLDQSANKITSSYIKTWGGGIRGSIITTFYLIIVSLAIALPIGLASAIYLNEYAGKTKFNRLIRSGIETLTGVPSIVYGLMGVTVLFPITQMLGATTTNILLGAITLAIILLPTIIRASEEAMLVVPQHLRDASLSLGANQSQTIFKIVLPCAIPGILTGILLSIGRIIGESAALIYTMGTFINDSPTLLSQGTSLAVHIWSIMSGEQPNFALAGAISLVILGFVLVLNITVKLLSNRLNKAWY